MKSPDFPYTETLYEIVLIFSLIFNTIILMDEQNILQPNEPIQGSKNIWIVVISVVATGLIVGGGVYVWQRSILKSTEKSLQQQITSLQNQVENLKQGQSRSTNSLSEQSIGPETQVSDNEYKVILRENLQNSSKTDVYIKNIDSGHEEFFMTLADVYSQHYHNSEYHNGNLYIIRRIGYDGYPDETWSDELWKYNAQKIGTKMYSSKGIDFRVNDDEKIIAIITNEEFNLLDNSGKKIKTFQSTEVIANPKESPMFGFLAWGPNSIWLDNTFGPSLTGLVKIDTTTYSVTKYDLMELPAGPEFTINVFTEKLAFSNYPAIFDVDSAQEYEKSGAKVNLMVYDLKTKNQQQINTSITKRFEPKWIGNNTLEYNDPNSDNRIEKIIE